MYKKVAAQKCYIFCGIIAKRLMNYNICLFVRLYLSRKLFTQMYTAQLLVELFTFLSITGA